jgi:hypothetical protein
LDEYVEPPAPKVSVSEMSDLGVLKLEFDQKMNFGDKLPGENDLRFIMET